MRRLALLLALLVAGPVWAANQTPLVINSGQVQRLQSADTLATPAGAAYLSASGAPTTGAIAKFASGSTAASGDLSGDISTSGTLVTTIGANKVTLGDIAQSAANTMLGNWSGSTANVAANAMPSCSDTGGNHLNYVSGTGVTCGTSSGSSTPSMTINTQTGTTYTVLSSDQGKLLNFTNAGNVTITLPQATGSFGSGWWAVFKSNGGTWIKISPTTSTIDGLSGYTVYTGGAVMAVSDGTNYIVVPYIDFNTGNTSAGYSLQRADSTSAGGNTRGNLAVDLQLSRSTAAQVASGAKSFAVGNANTASGAQAVAMGDSNTASGTNDPIAIGVSNSVTGTRGSMGLGDSNTVGGGEAAAGIGQGNKVNGSGSVVLGQFGWDNSNIGAFVVGHSGQGANTSFPGRGQHYEQMFWVQTTGATAVRLTADGSTAGANNVGALPNSAVFLFQAECFIINRTNTGRVLTYTFGPSLLYRGANAASTVVGTGNPTATAGPTVGSLGALAAIPTITADTTNGGFNISYTPPVGNTDTLVSYCRVYGTSSQWS